MSTTITTYVKALFILISISFGLTATAQREVEKRIEVCAEDGKEKVTITTKKGKKEDVQVLEGEDAKQWMAKHEAATTNGTRVYISEEEQNGRQEKRIMVRSDVDGSSSNNVWVEKNDNLAFEQDAAGVFHLKLDLPDAGQGLLFVKDEAGEMIFEEKVDASSPIDRVVKMAADTKGTYTVGFKGEGTTVVKKLMIE